MHGSTAWVPRASDSNDPEQFLLYDFSELLDSSIGSEPSSQSLVPEPQTVQFEFDLGDSSGTFASLQPCDGWIPPSSASSYFVVRKGGAYACCELKQTPGEYEFATLYNRGYGADPPELSVQLRPGCYVELASGENPAYGPYHADLPGPERGLLVWTNKESGDSDTRSFWIDVQRKHRVKVTGFDPLSGVLLCRPEPNSYGLDGGEYYREWGNPSIPRKHPTEQQLRLGPISSHPNLDIVGTVIADGEGGQDQESDDDDDSNGDWWTRGMKERKGKPRIIPCQLSYIID